MLLPTTHHPFMLFRLFVIAIVGLLFSVFMVNTLPVQAQTPDASEPANDDILFLSQRDELWKVYVMNADGSDQRLVTNQINFPRSFIHEYSAVFSPDKTQIVIAVIKTTNGTNENRLYRVNADGTDLTLLWNGASDYLNPMWSPAGDRILFRGYSDVGSDIYVINSDSSDLKRLTEGGQSNFDSQWSPNGEQILFVADTEEGNNLSIINADGTGFHQVAPAPGYSDFAWSPDGQKIVFTEYDSGALTLVNPDGTGLENLMHMDQVYSPVWSPDGAHIAFTSAEDDAYMVNSDGSELVSLTQETTLGFACLDWLPNGEQLVAVGFPKGKMLSDTQTNIYIIEADGSGVITPLTDDSSIDTLPNCTGLFG